LTPDPEDIAKKMASAAGLKGLASTADESPQSDIIPTGCLSLDLHLGTGGWPTRRMVGIFGPRDVGKSVLALSGVANAQKMGLTCGWVAVEPDFDERWAELHGVDTNKLVIFRPESGEDAIKGALFMLDNGVQFMVFDSIGALAHASEMDAKDGKPRQGGQSGLITYGVKAMTPRVYSKNACVILLNQVRAVMSATVPGVYSQPGGNALEHHEAIVLQIRKGDSKSDRFYDPMKKEMVEKNAEGAIQVSHEVRIITQRNKVAVGGRRETRYDFFNTPIEGLPFGIDKEGDLLSVALRLNMVENNRGWFKYDGKSYRERELAQLLYEEKYDEIRDLAFERFEIAKPETH
jgi:recombination protein RecA